MYLSRISLRPDIADTQLPLLLQDRKGYGLHRLFWDLFSDGSGGKQARNFLFREEIAGEQLLNPGKRKAAPIYYVLSHQEPKNEHPLFSIESKSYRPKLSSGDRLGFKLRVNPVVRRDGKRHDIVMDAQQSWLRDQLQAMDLGCSGTKNALKAHLLDHAGNEQISAWGKIIEGGVFSQKLEQRLGRLDILEWAIKTVVELRVRKWWQEKSERLGFDVAVDEDGLPILESMAYQKHHLPEKAQHAGFNSLDLSGELIVRDVAAFERLLFEGIGPSKAFGCGLMLIRRL